MLFNRGHHDDILPMKNFPMLLILLAWCSPVAASALFEGNTVIEIQLNGPLKSVINDEVNRQEQPFLMEVDGVKIPVKVKMRGKSRARVCRFPPLRLNFTGSDTRQTVFEGQEELKLVTHCRDDKGRSMNVLEEYAAYRILNLLTDYSYRVRLLRIHYLDTGGDPDTAPIPEYGFVIEPESDVLARTTGEWAHLTGVKLSKLEENQAALVYVFQYLIGNTDWSLVMADGDDTCCHNIDLLEADSRLYLVPYDFDLSGLVNASYAKPDASLRLKNVRQRRYRGYCINPDAVRNALQLVRSKRTEIMGVLEDLPDYEDKAASKSVKYLDKFFESAEDESRMMETVERWCLG